MAPVEKAQSQTPDRKTALALLTRYGALLSDRQRDFAHQHFVQNRKYAEIGREAGVSRQAVFDAVRKALVQLEDIDSKINETSTGQNRIGDAAAVSRLETLRRRVASQGIIYSSDWIVRELAEIRDALNPSAGGPK